MIEEYFYPSMALNLALASGGRNKAQDLLKLEGVEPKSLTVESNNIFTADTFQCVIDGDLFPLDPTRLDAVVIDAFMGDRDDLYAPLGRGPDTRVITGHADKIVANFDPKDRPYVELSGRDYTSFLLDATWGNYQLKLGRPLDELVREVLDRFPSTKGFDVRSLLEGKMPVIPKGKGKAGSIMAADPKDKAWDVLQNLSRMVGVILTLRADEVLIQPPLNVSPLEPASYPVFVDGQNLTMLKLERAFTREDLPNILVVGRDRATGRRVEGSWPDPPNQTVKISKSTAKKKPAAKKLPGVPDKAPPKKGKPKKSTRTINQEFREYRSGHPAPTPAIMQATAKSIYEGFRQKQLKVSFGTREVRLIAQRVGKPIEGASFGHLASAVRNGTPIRIYIDRQTRSLLDGARTQSAREAIARRQGFKRQVAAELAKGWRTLDRLFYVETATHVMTQADGYELSGSAVNFLEVSL